VSWPECSLAEVAYGSQERGRAVRDRFGAMTELVIDPVRRGRTRLADGRSLAWAEWGPEDGAPVLFCPGAGTGCSLGLGYDVARLGVRLIAVDRPGLGGSDPDPGRSLLSFADDVRALGAVRGMERPRVLAFSQGAPFALGCASAGVASAVAIVSGSDELAAPEIAAQLVPDVRGMVARVAEAPEGAEAFFRGMTAAMMREMVLSMIGPSDRAIYLDPTFDAAYRRALDEGFAQGADGYARDTVLAMGAWPFELGRISVPVELWYGSEDTSPVHSPDLGASLARRIPDARRTVLAGGGAILWTHATTILESLLRARGQDPGS